MRLKPNLRHVDIRCYLAEHEAMQQRQLLDCCLGINRFGVSERVIEAARAYDWSRLREYPDHNYLDSRNTGLRRESNMASKGDK